MDAMHTQVGEGQLYSAVYLDEPLVFDIRGDDALGVNALVEANVRLVRAGRPGSRRRISIDNGYGSGICS